MRTGIKFFLIFAIFITGSLLFMIFKRMSSSGNPIGYFIIFPAMFAAIGAIWKYNPEKKEKEKRKDNGHTLDKS